jgi:antitoxin HigA-1
MRTKSRSSITTRRHPPRKVQPPIHPGEALAEDFLRPLGITQYRLAKGTRVPPRRINEIVHGVRAVTADTALRLGRFFGTSEQFWLNLQARYDLEKERDRLGNTLAREVEVWGRVARRA